MAKGGSTCSVLGQRKVVETGNGALGDPAGPPQAERRFQLGNEHRGSGASFKQSFGPLCREPSKMSLKVLWSSGAPSNTFGMAWSDPQSNIPTSRAKPVSRWQINM